MTAEKTKNPGTYLILGGSGGIGSALAKRLAARGANVALAARDADRLAATAQEIEALSRVLDARSTEAVETFAKETRDHFGRLDGIANCVGSILLKPAHLIREEEWQDTLDINLGTAFAAVRAAGRVMKEGGSVTLVSSAAVRIGLPNHEAISAAKAGIEGLVRAAAATYAQRGLRINAVAPGLVDTPLTARITGNEAARNASLSLHALGRLGRAEDVAAAMDWLLGPDGDWITGQILGVDGGLGSVRASLR